MYGGSNVSSASSVISVISVISVNSVNSENSVNSVGSRGGIWLHSQLPSTRVYGDYQLIITINSSIRVNNRTRSAAECHP